MRDERTALSPGDSVLALDPGVSDAGLAVMTGGRLTACSWLRPVLSAPDPCPVCVRRSLPCRHAAGPLRRGALISELLRQSGPLSGYAMLVTEGQFLPAPSRSIDPAPLLELSALVGAVTALAHQAGVRTLVYSPREWKGTAEKSWFQCQILASLTASERELVPRAPRSGRYLTDPVDAAGLALFAVGRLGRWHADPARFVDEVETASLRAGRRGATAGRPAPSPAQCALL